MVRYVLVFVVLLLSSPSRAQIRCRLDAAGVPHCSTSRSRAAAAQRFVANSVAGFDVEARRRYVETAAEKWVKRNRQCRPGVDSDRVYDAYNYPGADAGLGIYDLEGCERAFALWLFAKENGGRRPSALAQVQTVVAEDAAEVRKAKQCREEGRALVKADRAWLAAERALAGAAPKRREQAAETAREKKDAREEAMKAFNECMP